MGVTSDDKEETDEGTRHGTLFVGEPYDVSQEGPKAAKHRQRELSAVVRRDVKWCCPGEQPDADWDVP